MEEKITLDRETFKALASDSRVNILKSLHRRRKTLTELSKQFGIAPSTVKEHLDSLSGAGLVIQKDEGHKWKYYELTQKGRSVVAPSETKIWIVLSIASVGLFFAAFDLIRISSTLQATAFREAGESIPASALPSAGIMAESSQAAFPYLHTALIVIFMLAMVISVFLLARKRRIREEMLKIKSGNA